MELTGTQTLPVSQQIAWDALNDPDILKASITGCDELTRVSDTEFATAVTAAVGPVKAKFKAKLTLQDVVVPASYTIRFDGQGGVAGFGKGEAQVKLTVETPGTTRLDYSCKASVGGKLAQIGSRLVDAAAKKMSEEFFTKFNAELARRNPAAVATAAAATAAAAAVTSSATAPQAAPGAALQPMDNSGSTGMGGLMLIAAALVGAIAAIGFFLSKF